jgi:hypothetical protein
MRVDSLRCSVAQVEVAQQHKARMCLKSFLIGYEAITGFNDVDETARDFQIPS